jgi:hypothetical protein
MYVERAATDPNGSSYAQGLSYFGPDILAPYAPQLLALYERQGLQGFRANLNFGIGGAGPAVVDKLIGELDNGDAWAAASAAVSLCRAGDARAAEPLLAKLRGRPRYPISYAYALARLGRGKDAQSAMPGAGQERSCLNEIVEKYPAGNAPDSICIIAGPSPQPPDAAWQLSESRLRCLAPRTPSPNG